MVEWYGLLAVVLSYLVGAISFSYLMTRFMKGVDIRDYGSGNAGATNTMRVLGKGPAMIVFLCDAGKGALAVGFGSWLTGNETIMMLCGLAAIIGHNWPVYLGFRGGKGIATTIGVTVTLMFYVSLIAVILAILAIVFTRYVSLGSLVFTISVPLIQLLLMNSYPYPLQYMWYGIITAVLAIIRHRENIQRLMKGNERKIGEKGD